MEENRLVSDHSLLSENDTVQSLLRRIKKLEEERVVIEQSGHSSHLLVESIPRFSGDELGESADSWCDMVENITQGIASSQRLCYATHALSGSAREWYRGWRGNPRTWVTFREDICSIFTTDDRIGQLLRRAVLYTSDSAVCYAEYARTKLKYLQQTKISFKVSELIRLVISDVTDSTTRQSLTNARYSTTAELITGMAIYVKPRDRKEDDRRKQSLKHPHTFFRPGRRCFTCDGTDHVQAECPKRRKIAPATIVRPPPSQIPVCAYCTKKGHNENECWVKQRAHRYNSGDRSYKANFNSNKLKPEVNFCYSMPHQVTPIILRDLVVRSCIVDGGATCSLVKEAIARRANCKVEPASMTVQGIQDALVRATGKTTAMVQTEDVTLEMDLLVVPDATIPYDVMIGRNVLARGGLRMLTEEDGTSKLIRRSLKPPQKSTEEMQPLACVFEEQDSSPGKQLDDILKRYQSMVTDSNIARQKVTTGQLKITLKNDKIINYHPYRLSITEREKVRAMINELLKNGIIRESVSPFASPIILVKKKNGEDRMCVDYRALNRITVKDRFPLPLIDDQLDRLGHNRYYTILDMASGFHQIPIAEDSISKTAFVTPDGHYEYLRMPFGLANAPAVFQRAINAALGNLKYDTALVYLDDVLIPSLTIKEGLEKLERVLHALQIAGFSLNIKKCKFLKTEIEYLGRIVSADGIKPGKEKVRALVESPVPSNVKQVRQFMGLAGYFRKFVPEFAVRTACITKLTKNNEPWCWGVEQEEARKYIIDKLTSEPLLVVFDPSRETELHTDASSIGYGAVLFQNTDAGQRVVAYFSRRTTPEESRYHSYELETLAVVNALKYFRVYLVGIPFKLVTDCNALKATNTKKDLLPRVARWWIYLQDFTYTIEYRKGRCIEHADYFSRNPRENRAYYVTTVCEGSWLEIAQANDDETKALKDKILANDTICSDFTTVDTLLCRKLRTENGKVITRLFVPKGSRLGILRLYHDENCHVGSDKVFDRISRKYWFPRMRAFINKYIQHCLTCIVAKRHTGPKQGLLHSIDKSPIPFDTIHCDCVGPFIKTKDGSQYVLLIVDAFTKYIQLIPLTSLTGEETLHVFKERLLLFGRPRRVILDRGTNFTYKALQQFLNKQNVEVHFIATGAPRANGQAERYVSTVINLLTVETLKSAEWPSKLLKIQETLNTTKQATTGFSPTRLLFGIERSAGSAVHLESDLPNIEEQINTSDDRKLAYERLQQNSEKQNARFNEKRRNNVEFKENDTVFLKPAVTRRAKLDPKYLGPYVISKILSNDRYQIVGKTGRPQVAPKDRLRLWKGEWNDENDKESDCENLDEPC